MRRTLQALTGFVAVIGGSAVTPAYSEGPATFAAEVFATPSYHLMEVPKVEEGGEGFAWSYLNQQPESWGRALLFWSGPTSDAVFATSVPQQGPLTGHRWKAPGAWTSYPPGGDAPGLADYGEPARFPLGTTVETPGGTARLLSLSGRAGADEGVGEVAFGAFQSSFAPLRMGFASSFSSARREEDGAVSSGWAVARDVQIGEVSIAEIRSDASVRATAAGETGTWKLTIAGVSVGGQRLEWTNNGVSFAPGSEAALQRLNGEMAKGAESFRSEFQLVAGRVWRDDAGTHVQSGFLQMGHRPVILENNPGQKMVYALSVVSARALYRAGEPGVGLDGDLPAPAPEVPGPAGASAANGPAVEIGEPVVVVAPEAPVLPLPPVAAISGDLPGVGVGGGGDVPPVAEPAGGAVEAAAGLATTGGLAVGGQALAAPAAVTGLGGEAARKLRGGIGLAALAGVAAALAVLRVARRQLELS